VREGVASKAFAVLIHQAARSSTWGCGTKNPSESTKPFGTLEASLQAILSQRSMQLLHRHDGVIETVNEYSGPVSVPIWRNFWDRT
jgi:hypothetical protein